MSNQQNPHDEFGGFGESDDQTFLHDSAKSSPKKTTLDESAFSDKSEGMDDTKDGNSGFISYVKPDIPEEEEQSSLKKVGLIAFLTIAAAATIWMILPSKDNGEANPENIVVTDTIAEKEDEQVEIPQKTTLEQDSIARVQDYLARMQMSQGKNIGNNERSDEIAEDQAPVAEEPKAPEKKVIPPDPIPAKTFPEYREANEVKQAESIQSDEPVKTKPQVSKPAPIVKKPNPTKSLAQKPAKVNQPQKSKEKLQTQKQKEQNQVIDETFDNGKAPTNLEKTKITSSSNEEYAVQVMSSISKDEADKALKNLKVKGVSSASITKKSLNGKTWYRVRFGSFEDRKKAQNAAKKVGYSNAWIDRVK